MRSRENGKMKENWPIALIIMISIACLGMLAVLIFKIEEKDFPRANEEVRRSISIQVIKEGDFEKLTYEEVIEPSHRQDFKTTKSHKTRSKTHSIEGSPREAKCKGAIDLEVESNLKLD